MVNYKKTSPKAIVKGKGAPLGDSKNGKLQKTSPKAIVKGKGVPLGDSENGKLQKIVPKGSCKGKRGALGGIAKMVNYKKSSPKALFLYEWL